MRRLRLDRRELAALANLGAPAGESGPARAKVAAFLSDVDAREFVLSTVGCVCPVGFGAPRERDCPTHGATL